MTRPFNFSAGPAVLPEAVLERASQEMSDFAGSGWGDAAIFGRPS